MEHHEASCSCGQLRAITDSDPVSVSVCHCLACQRRTGSAFGVQARFNRDEVSVSGEWREFVRRADEDGEERRQAFCPVCGSTVFYDYGTDENLIIIPVGALADPTFPAPGRSIWEDRRHAWAVIDIAGIERVD